jgi:hypothetical protein
MPITSSGQIALIADIAAEFTSLGSTDVSLDGARAEAGLTAGEVAMTDFYGLSDAVAPSVTTNTATSITTTSMTIRGNVTSDGGGTITERGFYFGTNSASPTNNTKYTVSGTTGAYSRSMTGLSSGTTYYWWAFATNSAGTTYGSRVNAATSLPAHGVTLSHSGGGGGQSAGYACDQYGDPSFISYSTNTNSCGSTVTLNFYNTTFGSCSPTRKSSAYISGWNYTSSGMVAYLPNSGSDSSFTPRDERNWSTVSGTQTGGNGYQYCALSASGFGTTYYTALYVVYS